MPKQQTAHGPTEPCARGRHVAARHLQLVPVVALGVLLLGFSLPILGSLHRAWFDYTYSHGYLVLAVVLWLIARELRREPLRLAGQGSWLGLICLVITVGGIVVGQAATTMLVTQLLFPVLGIAAIWLLCGGRNALRFVWPTAYLYFTIPLWEVFNEPLRSTTVVVVSMWIRAAGLPAFIDGDLIHIPSGVFEVAGGCSGLHFVIIALALAALIAHLNQYRVLPRIVLGLFAVGLALLANWLRVFAIVVAGHETQMQHYLVTEDHYLFGWIVFFICLSPMFYIDRRLQQPLPVTAPRRVQSVGSLRTSSIITPLAVVVLVLALALQQRLDIVTTAASPPGELKIPASIDGWQSIASWNDSRRPVFIGADREVATWYGRGTARIGVYAANYAAQTQGREVVFYANRPQGADGVVLSASAQPVRTSSGTIPFTELEVDDAGHRRLAWVGITVAGRSASGSWEAKALQAAGAIMGRRDAQVLVLSAACVESCEAARAQLAEYASGAVDELYSCAERATASRSAAACKETT